MESPLIGRDAERSALRAALAAARAGNGGSVSVLGEAGAGKTRLLDDLAGVAAATGMTTLRGTAVQGGGPFRPLTSALLTHLRNSDVVETASLRPYRAALHRLVPGWPAAETADPVTVVDPLLVLSEAVLRLLLRLAQDGGVLLLVDDLHWADPDTLAVLGYLVEAIRAEPILVVTALRTDEAPPAGLGAVRRQATRLLLGPLPADGTAELVRVLVPDASADDQRRIAAQSDGLPLLIEELCRWSAPGAGSAPTGRHPLAVTVTERMEGLEGPARRLLEAAAVIGAEFDWQLLAGASAAGVDALAELLPAIAVGFLEVVPASRERLRWRHAALRDAVLDTLLPAQVVAVARRAAAVFDTGEMSDPDGEQQAELLVRAGEPGRAATILTALAEQAMGRSALRTAEDLLRRAEALGGGLPARLALVRVLDRAGRSAEALECGSRLLADPLHATDRDLCLAVAGAALTAAQWGTAVELLDRIPGADPAALAARADALFGAGDPVGAQRAALGALDAGNDDPAAQGQAWAVLGQCLAVNDPAGSVVAWRQAATLAARQGLSTLRVRAAIALALTAAEQDEPWQQLKVVRDLAIDAGLLASAAAVDLLTGDVLSTVEGPAAGLGYARQAASLSADLRLPALEATAHALVAALSAERDETPTGTMATRLAADAPDEIVALSALATAMTYLHRDDVGAMYELLDEGTARIASPTAAPLKYWGIWAVLAAAHGRWDGPAQQRFAASSAAMNPLNVAGRLLADAVLAGREQGPDAAGRLYREALDLIPQRRWWAAVLAHLVQPSAVADGWGTPTAELRRLAAEFDRFDAPALARICRYRLRALGEAVPRRGRGTSPVSPALAALGVTSRELDVLALIREGHTNAEIAVRLYLSTRTVETHVAHLLTKTGAAGRARLPVAIDRLISAPDGRARRAGESSQSGQEHSNR